MLKTLDINRLNNIIEAEKKGKQDDGSMVKYVIQAAKTAPKTYYTAVLVGYLIAIIATVVIMFVFNHGQPALLYLVPGCILSVAITALVKGEMSKVLEFVEERFYGVKEGEETKKAS